MERPTWTLYIYWPKYILSELLSYDVSLGKIAELSPEKISVIDRNNFCTCLISALNDKDDFNCDFNCHCNTNLTWEVKYLILGSIRLLLREGRCNEMLISRDILLLYFDLAGNNNSKILVGAVSRMTNSLVFILSLWWELIFFEASKKLQGLQFVIT